MEGGEILTSHGERNILEGKRGETKTEETVDCQNYLL